MQGLCMIVKSANKVSSQTVFFATGKGKIKCERWIWKMAEHLSILQTFKYKKNCLISITATNKPTQNINKQIHITCFWWA